MPSVLQRLRAQLQDADRQSCLKTAESMRMFNRCTEDLEPRLSCDRETYSRHLSKESADGGAHIQYEHCGTQTTCAQRDPVKLQICGEDTVTAAVCCLCGCDWCCTGL